MKRLTMPVDETGWERLASSLVKANLKLAQMSYLDLEAALSEMGLEHGQKNVSAKLKRSRISAAFFLQCLVAAGVETIDLPRADD